LQQGIKVLGVHMDEKLTWSEHISKTINKMKRLTSGLYYLRRRLTEEQFIQVMTSQYYGMTYYGCQAWLGSHTRKMDLKKLDSLHYKMLRIVKKDYKRKIGRHELDTIGRARPTLWGKYSTANLVLKVLRDAVPRRLSIHLETTRYNEKRKPDVVKFYDASTNKQGFQAIANRLHEIFLEIAPQEFTLRESNDALRVKLKRCLKMVTVEEENEATDDNTTDVFDPGPQ
ncbi:MAG: hypothetical protein EBU08_23690, partial [Micrococcales bacterium]|nr:hypothetical protein [Micrococcales bacterium]